VRSEDLGVRSEELGVRSEELGVRSEELIRIIFSPSPCPPLSRVGFLD